MAEKIEFYIPFDENIADGEWKFFFPLAKVHHMGMSIDFTRERGENMVSNFKNKIPDFDLPINLQHNDGLGIYGHIADLRLGEKCVEWLPKFNDGAVKEIKAKGYKYASPEIIFDGYQGVFDGKYYKDVALAIAITPRPRLGRETLVFSEGEWRPLEGDDKDTEEAMPEEITLNEEQFGELNKTIGARIGEFFVKLLGSHEDENEDESELEAEDEQETELQEKQEPEMSEEEKAEFAEKLEEKDGKILELEDKMKELEEKAQKYDEQLRLAEAEAEKERQNARKIVFTETAKEIHGLPEMELDFAEELMWLEDADESEDKAHYNAVLNVLKALGEQKKAADLFSEKGNDGKLPQTPSEKLEALVAAKVKEGKSVPEAYAEVFKENPGLYKEYDSENTKVSKE